jgi:hypothetical protein
MAYSAFPALLCVLYVIKKLAVTNAYRCFVGRTTLLFPHSILVCLPFCYLV